MNRLLVVLLIGVVTLLTACQSGAGSSQPTDPAAVMDAYTAAINAHDVEKALSYVADDAVYHRPAGDFNGKEEIRGFIESLIARNVKVELMGQRSVNGESVTWQSHVTLENPAQELMNNSESIVRGGKIVMHTAQAAQ